MATLAVLGAAPLRECHEATVGQERPLDMSATNGDNF